MQTAHGVATIAPKAQDIRFFLRAEPELKVDGVGSGGSGSAGSGDAAGDKGDKKDKKDKKEKKDKKDKGDKKDKKDKKEKSSEGESKGAAGAAAAAKKEDSDDDDDEDDEKEGDIDDEEETDPTLRALLKPGVDKWGDVAGDVAEGDEDKVQPPATGPKKGASASSSSSSSLGAVVEAKPAAPSSSALTDALARQAAQHAEGGRVFMHPRSALFGTHTFPVPWVSYLSIVQTSKPFVQDATTAAVYPLLLFGGDITSERDGEVLCVDGWVRVRPQGAKIAVLMRHLRAHLDKLLTHLISHPGDRAALESPVLEAIVVLIRTNGNA